MQEIKNSIVNVLSSLNTYDRARNNMVEHYIDKTSEVFRARFENKASPAPICVQVEITNTCTTGCKMCNRWTWISNSDYDKRKELTTGEFVRIFDELQEMGVRNMIWTGGEPVAHPDFVSLLAAANERGFAIGVLSNGVGVTETIAEGFAKYARWVRISVDDVPNSPTRTPVRRLLKDGKFVHENEAVIDEISESLSRLKNAKAKLNSNLGISFGYTMQKNNIEDTPKIISYARSQNIPINFKFANGENGRYLCTEEQIKWFRREILSDESLISDPSMNFEYLRSHFLQELSVEDVIKGVPLKSYYEDKRVDCFTTSIFSLIDSFGGVYPCCHLFDDNGPLHSKIREENLLGQLSESVSFGDVWWADTYNSTRESLYPVGSKSQCAICTRHWVPNTTLTELYRQVFLPAVSEFGLDEGATKYSDATSELAVTGNVWF